MPDIDFSDYEPLADGASSADHAGDAAGPRIEALEPTAGERSYVLLAPRRVDGEPLRRITLRALTQQDLDDVANGEIASRRLLLCRLAGLHPDIIRSLIWPDSEAIHQMFIDMLPDFLKD
ncbi:phage tail assembly protein [Rhizobium straminoryzae]|uniref:Phage tail assembly protein n=1 Tax=Rhizobium straminoryzae TaxID=1387186 RepID=A0A549T0S4_9HYPH|nr:phage tail assembly protein [Rhizobium straminoryzae]TRL35487.1 hypothetical protein FNA46_20000 [Rhizobium straminoryzae]